MQANGVKVGCTNNFVDTLKARSRCSELPRVGRGGDSDYSLKMAETVKNLVREADPR